MSRQERLFYQLNQSISKAINPVETPVKQKHVRSTIIGTFQEKGAVTFWVVVLRQPLQENRIVAWKFCHVLHIILREGHYNCLEQSQRHVKMIEDLGKLWVHLKEGYGKLIQLYCNLMIAKINFHQRNHRFPGNLQLTAEELEDIGENDINNYFQMSVEIFDYMDEVLTLQAAIFESIDNRSTSMTSSGQCRLAPILPCVQDSNQLYDFSVKLLFKLHSMLPPDTLLGHRERFSKQFKMLKKFYQKTQVMQYFKNLISIPTLPPNPPNFLIQSELRTYVPPVVILPPEEQFTEEQDLVGNLIDTSDTSSQLTSPDTPSDLVDYSSSQSSQPSDPIIERDMLIEHLQNEITRSRNEIHNMIADHRVTMQSINEHVSSLENQLMVAKDDLEHEKKQRNTLEEQQKSTQSTPEIEKRILAAEDRAKGFEEKFQKLKAAYTQMKEEHITLLRQKAESDKQVNALKKSTSELEMKVEALQTSNNILLDEKSRVNSVHVQSVNNAQSAVDLIKQELNTISEKHIQEKENLSQTILDLQSQVKQLGEERALLETRKETDLETLKNQLCDRSRDNEIEKETFNVNILQLQDELSKLKINNEELVNVHEVTLNQLKQEMNDIVLKNNAEKDVLNNNLAEVNRKHSDLINEIDLLQKQNEEKVNILLRETETLKSLHQGELQELQTKLSASEDNFNKLTNDLAQLQRENESMKSRLSWCNNEKSNLECDLQDLLQQKLAIEDSLSVLSEKFKEAEIALSREISNTSLARWSLMKSSLQSSADIIKETIHELDNPAISSLQCGVEYFKSLLPITEETFGLFEPALVAYEKERVPSEDAATQLVNAAHLVGTNVIQGVATSNTSKDLVFGEQMAQECRELANTMLACINHIKSVDETTSGVSGQDKGVTNGDSHKTVEQYVSDLRRLLQSVGTLAERVGGQDDGGAGDSVEGELANMDKVIEEAAARIEEMLQKSRAADSGMKLEVNGKILDACTSLMAAVRELVKKARLLQGEIVTHGRGTNTAKEFYKRNHQWTEGLISAAKSVAMGAKLLLTAADKVVSGSGGKLEQVMVASQEIAASTAQLVVASRVRAERGSQRLGALTLASRSVSSATGAVIATAKACATMVEESEDLDMTGMSWQAGRRLEMESRVRVLELEQSLATERLKLAALRRTHYRLENSEDAEAKM